MPWRARGTLVFSANRPIGIQSCPAPPGSAAPPCVAPPRPARGMSWFWIRQVAIRLCVIPKRRSRQLFSMRWRARGTVISGAHRRLPVLSECSSRGSTCRIQNPDIRTTGGSGRRGARRGGGAGRGRAGPGRRRVGSPQETSVPLALQAIEDNCPESFSGRTKKRNPM